MSSARRRIADPTLVGLAMALSLFGIAMVYSAGQTDVPTAVAIVIGEVMMSVLPFALASTAADARPAPSTV